jgi:uncharacterized protein with PIN domain
MEEGEIGVKFVCDAMLGKLARHLRLFGLDAPYIRKSEYLSAYTEDEETPFFLTRRRESTSYLNTVHVLSDRVLDQLTEIKDLVRPYIRKERLLSRCVECNVELSWVEKGEIEHLVPEFVFHHYHRFMVCRQCNRVYWEGSHVEKMDRILKEVLT